MVRMAIAVSTMLMFAGCLTDGSESQSQQQVGGGLSACARCCRQLPPGERGRCMSAAAHGTGPCSPGPGLCNETPQLPDLSVAADLAISRDLAVPIDLRPATD